MMSYHFVKADPGTEPEGGGSLQTMIEDVTYDELVEKFGEPTYPFGDGDKTDAEWVFATSDGPVTIYNYHPSGLRENPYRLTVWHVGGKDATAVSEFLEHTKLNEKEMVGR